MPTTKKLRKVIPWTLLRGAIKSRDRKRFTRPMTNFLPPHGEPLIRLRDHFAEPPKLKSHGVSEPCERPGLSDRHPRADGISSAIHSPHPHLERCLEGQADIAPAAHEFDLEGATIPIPCSIMGNILLTRQRVEDYPSETHYQPEALAFRGMPKPSENQEHRAISALRRSIRTLREERGVSYAEITKATRAIAKGAGRNLNNLVLRRNYPKIDSVLAGAEYFQIELWQLCVPGIAELDRIERKQLKELVETFVRGGPAARGFLLAALGLMKPTISGDQGIDRI